MAGEDRLHLLPREKPPVQVVGRTLRHCRMQTGVNEVWPDLETLHAKPPTAEGRHQAQRHSRLADATRRTANQQPMHRHVPKQKAPLRSGGMGLQNPTVQTSG